MDHRNTPNALNTRSACRNSAGSTEPRQPAIRWVARACLVASLGTLTVGQPAAAQSPPDRPATIAGVREFDRVCRRDAGRLWGVSLCGPLIVVDGSTGFAVATAKPPAGQFTLDDDLWIGQVPEGMNVANTAMDWAGERWSTVRAPLPVDPFLRRRLLLHEAFHRIQPDLGLTRPDAMNGHLDERDGRALLRLELRALSRAVTARGPTARMAVRDALTFRARRHELFPGADTLEAALEMQEGLAEYTGTRLAMAGAALEPVRRAAADFETRPTFVRSLGYGTGPLLGLLLDRYRAAWRRHVAQDGFASQLARVFASDMPRDLAAAVAEASDRYDGARLFAAEEDRARARATRLARYRATLIEGPVIILAAAEMSRSFNPNNLVPLGNAGTVYPTGSFTAEWGQLEVTGEGALVPPGNQEVRLPVPPSFDPGATELTGPGWRLVMAPGWRLVPADRPGDVIARRAP